MSDWNSTIIDEFRAKGGRNVGHFGDRLLLMTVRGRKTGAPRTIPLAYHREGDRIIVAASKGGAPTNPDWYANVVAQGEVELEIGNERFRARATPLPYGPERDGFYARHADQMPGFRDYEQKTQRTIPIVVFERIADADQKAA